MPEQSSLGRWSFNSYLVTADMWPRADVGDEFRTEVVSQIPFVFEQGDWDTQTPIENLLQVSPYFTNSRVLIACTLRARSAGAAGQSIARGVCGIAGVCADRRYSKGSRTGDAARADVCTTELSTARDETRIGSTLRTLF
jgi:hypothetical protein